MAFNGTINFDDCYDIEKLSNDLSLSKFNTVLKNLDETPLGIQISDTVHPHLPELQHDNHSKVFSAIIFTALAFLTENKEKYLGIDGSNNARAYMY